MTATDQYFPVALFITLYKAILLFESVGHNESCMYWAVLSCGSVTCGLQCGSHVCLKMKRRGMNIHKKIAQYLTYLRSMMSVIFQFTELARSKYLEQSLQIYRASHQLSTPCYILPSVHGSDSIMRIICRNNSVVSSILNGFIQCNQESWNIQQNGRHESN